MLNTSFRIMNNVEDAEDVVQEAFLKAFRSLHTYREEASFGAWLKRIVVNHAINALKKKRLDLVPLENKHQETPSSGTFELEGTYSAKEALDALHQLPTGYRTVFSLYLLEGYDHNEISQILGVTVSTSISQYNRAKQKLRTILQEKHRHGQDRAVIQKASGRI